MSRPQTVNIRPTDDQYEAIARRFIGSLAHDVSEARGPDGPRRAEALLILRELLGLVAYLATLPDGVERIERLKTVTEQA
jgi:hypothetical protein